MAGGKGERFWPWSREKHPKQLLPLFGKKTLVELTVERLRSFLPLPNIWIVTNRKQAHAMVRLMPFFPKTNFIIEPVGRDSAGAVMLGCATVVQRDPDAVTALLPADHLIKDIKTYRRTLRDCFEIAACNDILMTIGIKPRGPSSAYGYIERGPQMVECRTRNAECGMRNAEQKLKETKMFQVRRFVEKPDLPTARRLVKSGRYYWNAGIFVWSASAIYRAFKQHSPIHAKGWQELQKNRQNYLREKFKMLPKISIDYAVMEKVKNIWVAEGTFGWDDIGSWTALYAHMQQDAAGNCSQGKVFLVDSQQCLVLGGKQTIAALGIRDLVIIQTKDATLVCHRDAVQRVKELIQRIPFRLR